jgi:hypothetical protein
MKTRPATDRLVERYLDELDDALRAAPDGRRRELTADVRDHIAQARAELPGGGSEAEVRTLLDRLGDPADIAAEAVEAAPPPPPGRRGRPGGGWVEWGALVLLPLGGIIVPFIGWSAGVALLWTSRMWSTRDKVLGTLVLPGGAMPAVFVAAVIAGDAQTCSETTVGGRVVERCTGGASTGETILWLAILAALAIAPLLMGAHLKRRLGGAERAPAAPAAG